MGLGWGAPTPSLGIDCETDPESGSGDSGCEFRIFFHWPGW